MTQSMANISAQKVKLSVYELNCLTSHPVCVAKCAGFLSDGLYENISFCLESDPSIALVIINLCRQKNIPIDFKNFDFPAILKQLSKTELLKTILGLKVYDVENGGFLSLIGSLTRRSGTRAFAAKLIAQKTGLSGTSEVLVAALFADVGLFALAQLFTKSLSMLVEEAKEKNVSLQSLEKEYLGITDNILSRMLLAKWQFGPAIADTAWLYSASTNTLTEKLPDGRTISIVRLADILAGSDFGGLIQTEHPQDLQSLVQQLSLADSDINEIKEKTQTHAEQINKLLGLEIENPQQLYSETIKQIYLNQLTALRNEDIFSQFMQKFITALNPQAHPIGIAETSAKAISECFLAQSICVFTTDPWQNNVLLASVINGCSVKPLSVNCPQGFSISQAAEETLQLWFYEQIGIEREKSCFIPIRSEQEIIAGIILSGPVPDENLFEQITAVLGKVFALSSRGEREKAIAELAADCLSQSKPPIPAIQQAAERGSPAEIAAELAAGAAHEMNNPLTVISGRAQLLLQSETDETKKLILNQIIEKIGDIGQIVGQLMSYARPARPQTRTISPFIVINNCLEKVNARYLSEPLDIKLENIESLRDVEIDPEQAAEAIAQIIYNSLESYESGNGPVRIIGSEQPQIGFVEFCIMDRGCGMSPETLQKATEPFFSDKPAGRQRGMGLSLAASFLKNNGCTLRIESQLDKGTAVTIGLPMTKKSENS
jgi:signal transduction histidine kinase